jgi:hypothetical protein
MESAEQCGICFEDLGPTKRKATTEVCEHPYCVGCLETWALKTDTCPTCRRTFAEVKTHGKRKREITVEKLRTDMVRAKKKSRRRVLRRVKRQFRKGHAYRFDRKITPAGVTLQYWKLIPRSEATSADISNMEQANRLTCSLDDKGGRYTPIEIN